MKTWARGRFVCVCLMLPILGGCREGSGESKQKVEVPAPAGVARDQVVVLAKSAHLQELDLDDSNMSEVVERLQHGLDRAVPERTRPQIRLAKEWSDPAKTQRSPADVRVTLGLRNIPLEKALEYVGEMTSTGFRYEDGFISLTPSLSSWGERKRCACGTFLDEDPEHSGAHE